MTQKERRISLIQKLIDEEPRYRAVQIPSDETGQKTLLRSLMNVRPPRPVGEEFLKWQDEYLREETARKGGYGQHRPDAGGTGDFSLEGRHYHVKMRRYRQCREFRYDRLLCPLSRLY